MYPTGIVSVENVMRLLMLHTEADMILKVICKRQSVNQQNLMKIVENVQKNYGRALGSTHTHACAVSAQLESGYSLSTRVVNKARV